MTHEPGAEFPGMLAEQPPVIHKRVPPQSTGSTPNRSGNDDTDLPEYVAVPAPPPPYATICILVLITVIFVAMVETSHGDVTGVALQFGAKDNGLIRQGQWWRLITPIFLHGSWPHLLINGFSLYRLGGSMERIYGARKYLIVLLLAGIAGNALSFLLSPSLSLGASGALFGLVGAGLVFPIRFRDLIPPDARNSILRQLAFVAVINLGIGFSLQGIIDNWAHVGGLLGGAFVALFLIPDVLESRPRSGLADGLVSAVLAVCVAAVLASWGLQWQWARRNPVITMTAYYPASGPAWWSISVPSDWRYTRGAWYGPNGAVMRIDDRSITDPATVPELLSIAKARTAANAELDGRRGWYTETAQGLLYRIPIYGRLFELSLGSARGTVSAQAKREFLLSAATVRFVRPPVSTPAVPSAPTQP